MAENKKSVLLYCDIIYTVEELDDADAGLLFKHYLRYINDQNPEPPSKLIKIVFEPIKQNLKRDLKKWESKSERNREIAIAGWEKRKDANGCERIKEDAKDADKVIVTDTVKDKVIVKETFNTKNNFKEAKEIFLKPYSEQNEFFRKEHTKTEYENFQKFLTGMFRDFTIEQLTSQWDRCIGIGDWKKVLHGKGFMIIKPALEKAIAAKEGNRDQMAFRIKTFTNGLLDEKVFSK